MDSGNTAVPPTNNTITDPISSLLNPNALLQPTFFHFPNPNPIYNPTFTSFPDIRNDDVYLNPQPPPTSNSNTDHHRVGVLIKNPKKRTRASRRAPATVLTTDTTNFRQMVQEFTGIPTTPFSRRLDLLGGGGRGSVLQNINCRLPASDIQGFQKQALLGSENSMFAFQKQTLLGAGNSDNRQVEGSCSSTNNDPTDKGLEM